MSTDLACPPAEASVTTPRKRNHDGQLVPQSPASQPKTSERPSPYTTARQSSPAPSDASSELTELTSIASPAAIKVGLDGASDANSGAKKRKLTFAEKEVEKAVRQREKEERLKQKAEEKRQREEEKRQRDEEKRRKEEEKEASKRAKELEKAEKKAARDAEKLERDAEKAKKDAEKRDKELEKLKKERSQLRIASFFGRPAPQSTPPATPDDIPSGVSSRRSSVVELDTTDFAFVSDIVKPANPDFEKYIIPYFVHENTDIAPVNRFRTADREDVFGGKQSDYEVEVEKSDVESIRARFGPPRKRLRMTEPVREVVERVQATQIDAVDLTGDYNPLAYVSYKILSFREDIRPPYIGTYTKHMSTNIAKKLSRRPTYRGRTDTNYDYDSEAEWEEPAADDEEILDDEMSESEDGDEEMQDFLDDDDDQVRKRMFAGEMEPVSSGICFQGEQYDSNGHDMNIYRMDVLHDSTTFPIDPFSSTHWSDIGKATPAKAKTDAKALDEDKLKQESGLKSMLPPRVPLATLNSPNILNSFLQSGNTIVVSQNENTQIAPKQKGRPANPNKEVKMIQAEFMDSFKSAVNGSDLTKAGLIEVLKKQFPKCSKDAIKDTLGVVAIRVGKKEAEKKWILAD